jgi:hypothetical protein
MFVKIKKKHLAFFTHHVSISRDSKRFLKKERKNEQLVMFVKINKEKKNIYRNAASKL